MNKLEFFVLLLAIGESSFYFLQVLQKIKFERETFF